MTRPLAVLLALSLAVTAVSCGKRGNPKPPSATNPPAEAPEKTEG